MKNKFLISSFILLLPNLLFSQGYNYLGSFSSNGTPNYLVSPGDQVSSSTLQLVGDALPEGYPVPDYNPHYISSGYDTDISISQEADVYVTFVKEGAGYKNVLGFYTYNGLSGSPDPDDITIIFPNVSASGSGGGLNAGDKVHLGRFSAGTQIGWVLFANGWKGYVTAGNWQLFSNPSYNPESDSNLRNHNVLLSDPDNQRVILGFEDIRRDYGSCDNDFNDAIFYVTASPYEAIQTSNLTDVSTAANISSANDGGLESNGRLALKIGKRNLSRSINTNFKDLRINQEYFSKSNLVDLKSTYIKTIEDYIPNSGMYGSEVAYISSPDDLIDITNAEKVFSVDYYQEENRIAAILATESKGSVYDHTKVICDRLNNSTLEDIRTVIVRNHEIISSTIKRAGGEIERSISFSIKVGDEKNELFSFWNIHQYPEGNYYNFQIWGSMYSQVFALANQIIDRFVSEKPLISEFIENKIPTIFVKSGFYSQGEIQLELINKSSSTVLDFSGMISSTEVSQPHEINKNIELTGEWEENIVIDVGYLFDIGFSIAGDSTSLIDALYLADGPWGLDFLEEMAIIDDFDIFQDDFSMVGDGTLVERNPSVNGSVKGTVNLFRHLLPGDQALEVSTLNAVSFEIENSQSVELVLVQKGLEAWDNRLRYPIHVNTVYNRFTIPFSEFKNGSGQNVEFESLKSIVFSVIGDYQNKVPFSLKVKHVEFKNEISTANYIIPDLQSTRIDNFPNPFNRETTIKLINPSATVNIMVYDGMGNLVDSQTIITSNNNRILKYSAKSLNSGIYYYRLIDDQGRYYRGSFIIHFN